MRLRWLLIIMCLAVSMISVGMIGGLEGFQIASVFLGLIIAVTFFVSLFISYFISYPLEKLTKNIDEISKGNLDVELEKSEIYEINNLTDSLNRVMASLKLAINKVGVKKGEIFEETFDIKSEVAEKIEDFDERLIDIDGTMEEGFEEDESSKDTLTKEKILDEISSSGTDYIFLFDENANVIDCNESMYRKLGYNKDEMRSLNLNDFDYIDSRKDILDNINKVKRLGILEVKTILKTKDGSSMFVTENIQYLKDTNLFKCIVKEDFTT